MNKLDTAKVDSMWKGVIAKWKYNVANPTNMLLGRVNCAFCREYNVVIQNTIFDDDSHNCVGCPISKHTGRQYCDDTPYNYVVAAQRAMAFIYRGGFSFSYDNQLIINATMTAQDELTFLLEVKAAQEKESE